MCINIAKNHRTNLYIAMAWISSAIILTTIALIANLAFWTAATAVVLMGFAFAGCLAARGNIWVQIGELPKLEECMHASKAKQECFNLFYRIRNTMRSTHILLIICCILTISAAAIAWLPLWGGIAIGAALAMMGVCLGMIIHLINLFIQLMNCLS